MRKEKGNVTSWDTVVNIYRRTNGASPVTGRPRPERELAAHEGDNAVLLVENGLVGAVVVESPQHVETPGVPLRAHKLGRVPEEARLRVGEVEERPVARHDVEVRQLDPRVLRVGPSWCKDVSASAFLCASAPSLWGELCKLDHLNEEENKTPIRSH